VILYRPALKLRAWWDTELARAWSFNELSAAVINRFVTLTPARHIPANDRDSIPW
jgi:hypothetical protein